MQNVSQLKGIFDRLPVSTGNLKLYQKLLDLDQTVYKPLMEEILAGRLDIEDTRPIFNVNISRIISDALASRQAPALPRIIQTPDQLKKNLINRAFNKNAVIKEVTLPNLGLNDLRMEIADAYKEQAGTALTDAEFRALMVAVSSTKDIDAMSGDNKVEQIKYVNAMAATPITEY